MHVSDSSAPLTLAQQAAVARICYALEQPGAVVLLCGPGGAGKSTVLAHVEGCRQLQSRAVCRRGLDDVQELLDGRGGREPSRLVSRCRSSRGPVGVVLAGEGRLFTLIARDARLEQLVRLRATLPPFSLDESRLLLASALTAAGPSKNRDAVARCIHEIAGGIPAVVRRLADTVSVFADAHPAHVIVPDDIETMHRRLSVNAA
jgi:type II secretory pathway predicted ATPase ExeA